MNKGCSWALCWAALLGLLVIAGCKASAPGSTSTETHGLVNEYDAEGALISTANYKKGSLHGRFSRFYPSGVVRESGKYKRGKRVGKYTYYYESGAVESWSTYRNGRQIGPAEVYHYNGKLAAKGSYEWCACVETVVTDSVAVLAPDASWPLEQSAYDPASCRAGNWIFYDSLGNATRQLKFLAGYRVIIDAQTEPGLGIVLIESTQEIVLDSTDYRNQL